MGFYHQQFETFNPVSGYVPSHPFSYLPAIAERARALLKTRTAEQIDVAASDIDWAIDDYFRDVKAWESQRLQRQAALLNDLGITPECLTDDDEPDIATADNSSEVDTLKECIDWWVDFGGDDFPDAKRHELFAVLALWLLADAMEWLQYKRSETLKSLPTVLAKQIESALAPLNISDSQMGLSLAGECALKAMDAVCHAEHLCEVFRLETEHDVNLAKTHGEYQNKEAERQIEENKRRSMKSEELNIARHREGNKARDMVIKEWAKDTSKFPSAPKAGLHFSNWLADQGISFEPSTVTDWIRAHAKKIGVRLR